MNRSTLASGFKLDHLRVLIRVLLAPGALMTIVAYAGSALGNAAVTRIAWQESVPERFVLAALGERWMSASNSPRRGATQEKDAVSGTGAKTAPALTMPRPPEPMAARAASAVVTATAPGPGQSGYVHYFVIEAPGVEQEIQVGIELDDGRIAWSFPELGVVVSPFIESGELQTSGRTYAVRHLYAIRPFPDDESLLVLQRELLKRVIPWVEDATPYCTLATLSNQPCLSCLGFVLRVLYPSPAGGMPILPPDFERSGPDMYFTTDDLLLYQTGLHGRRSREERLVRIKALTLPQNLRDDLIQLARSIDADDNGVPVIAATPKKTTGKKRPVARSFSKSGHQRSSQGKKL